MRLIMNDCRDLYQLHGASLSGTVEAMITFGDVSTSGWTFERGPWSTVGSLFSHGDNGDASLPSPKPPRGGCLMRSYPLEGLCI